MEVLHGNQPGSKHSRRQSDKNSVDENRSLDWSEQESDILLLPHSPLALANVLSHQGGFLDLLPLSSVDTPALGRDDTTDSPLDSSDQPKKRQQAKKKGRSNLLTQHSPSELLKRCKKILVENALVKNKGDRQLFLAAGFVSWPYPQHPERRQRAPVLLYPALLVRIPDEERYEIRLTGNTPEFNVALQEHVEQRFAGSLPGYTEGAQLADYFAELAQAVHTSDSLAVEFDVALGSASLTHQSHRCEKIKLPDVPANFDVPLAMSITGNKNLIQLTAVLSLIPDFAAINNADNDEQTQDNNSTDIAGLRRFAAKLAAEGLDHVEFRQLPELPELIDKWTGLIKTAAATPTIVNILESCDVTARELIKLSGIIELIDKAPDSIDQLGHGDLCYANSSTLLRRAQHQAKLIDEELQALKEFFVLDRIPAKSQLLSLISELGVTVDHEPDIVDADYFNARRQFMEFSAQKANTLTAEHRRQLSQLAKVLRFRELFVNNVEYRSALGPAYKGLRTDWKTLLQISEYARELSEVTGSETIAATIINNWQLFRQHFAKDLSVIQKGADATRRLLGLVGAHWQIQSIPAVIHQSKLIKTHLENWQPQYETIGSHAHKTPATVLSSFSGKSIDDVVVESHADDTQLRINAQLRSGKISLEQINDTISWLQEASSAAKLHDLDINAIVEHLQIA